MWLEFRRVLFRSCVLDGGSYDLLLLSKLAKRKLKFEKYFAIDPDPVSIGRIKESISKDHTAENVIFIQKALDFQLY